MKKNIFLLSLIGVGMLFSACSNEEDMLFDQSAAERLNGASELYSQRLMAHENGWAVQLYPTLQDEAPFGSGYLLLMKFGNDRSVTASMKNSLTFGNYKESTSAWEVITDNGPVLSFNTFNEVLHAFSYPEDVPTTEDNETGTGIGGDYEFVIVDAPEDGSYMMLKGKKRGTYNLLTPIEDEIDYEAYLDDVNGFQAKMFSESAPNFAVMHYGDSVCKFVDAGDGLPTIYPYDGDVVTESSFNPFLITKRGGDYYLRFRDALSFGDVTVQDYRYDVAADRFISVDNADFYLCGDDPYRLLADSLGSHNFSVKRSKYVADKDNAYFGKAAQDALESVYSTYRKMNSKYGPTEYKFRLMASEDASKKLKISVNYKPTDANTKLSYYYDYKMENGKLTLKYIGVATDETEKIRKQSESHYDRVKDALEVFNGDFELSSVTTAFDLSDILVKKVGNADFNFILSY